MTDVLFTIHSYSLPEESMKIPRDMYLAWYRSFRTWNQKARIFSFSSYDLNSDVMTFPFTEPHPWTFKPQLCRRIMGELQDGDRVIYADSDFIFLDDPFTDKTLWRDTSSVSVSSRMYDYDYSTTSGFISMWVCKRAMDLMDSYDPSRIKNQRGPEMEWFSNLLDQHEVGNLGWRWDFCPGIERIPRKTVLSMYKRAAKNREVKAIHLKGDSKLYLYEPEFITLLEGFSRAG